MIAVLCVAFVLLLAVAALVYAKQTIAAGAQFRLADSGEELPGPGLLPSQLHLTHLHESQESLPKRHGDYSLLYMMAKPALLLGDASAVREMMMERWQEFDRIGDAFKDNHFLGPMLDQSLFLLEDEEWKVLRKRLAGGFKFNTLKSMVPCFNNCGDQMGDLWEKRIQESPLRAATIDVSEWLTKMTTEVVGIVAFGVNFNAIAEGESKYLCHVRRIMQESTNFLSYIPGYSYLPTPGNQTMKAAVDTLTSVTLDVIQARKQMLHDNLDVHGFEPPSDLLQVMLDGQHGAATLSMQEVFSNAMGFLIAGSETTSVALTWALWLLAKEPGIQERARQEALAAFSEGTVDFAASEKLKYIGYVIKETMRLFPPAWMNVRRAVKETQLGNVRIPAQGMILVPVLHLHRAEKYWGADAAQFIPDRWDVEKISAGDFQEPPRGAYLPFNLGPRDCIGARFATLEMKVVLAKLLTRFTFAPEQGFQPEFCMAETLVPKHGMKLRVTLN